MIIRLSGADNNCCLSITSATWSSFECCPPGMLVRLARQAILRRVRNYATAVTSDPSKIRNIALVAHIGVTHLWLFQFPKSVNAGTQIPGRLL